MQVACTVGEVEEKLAELLDRLAPADQFEVESDDNNKIIAYDYKILIPSLDIYARDGAMLAFDAKENDWYADFSLTLLYNKDDEKMYWEQDGIEATLHNFLTAVKKRNSVGAVSDLECIIEISE